MYKILSIILCVIAMISSLLSILCVFAAIRALDRDMPSSWKAVPPIARLKNWFIWYVGRLLFSVLLFLLFLFIAAASGFYADKLSKKKELADMAPATDKKLLSPGRDNQNTVK